MVSGFSNTAFMVLSAEPMVVTIPSPPWPGWSLHRAPPTSFLNIGPYGHPGLCYQLDTVFWLPLSPEVIRLYLGVRTHLTASSTSRPARSMAVVTEVEEGYCLVCTRQCIDHRLMLPCQQVGLQLIAGNGQSGFMCGNHILYDGGRVHLLRA